ncbi:spermidine synthase [Palleronia pontilimi]|uniref:spermidine synthase n=1 Tax=Palleronia pontilimi TaxID=1964209 RepID=UPI001F48C06B|nr:spermidine synthase [Palleronia pontilimi]
MLPWIPLADGRTPDGDTLRLLRRGDEFSIRLTGGNELMNSRLGGSEEALATRSIATLDGRAAPHLLIGGLGMGFTLRAAQDALGPDATLTVAEIVGELADWARGPLAPVFGDCLDDPRVDLRIDDVARIIRAADAAFDAILLDVDNGPDGLTRAGNDALYSDAGLGAARRALRPGGVLAI